MLIENMKMAFSAIRANKMRSFLTMLGIIIGIGSVIAIVSIGDTMRSMFEGLYREIGVTQAYLSIGYWVDDVRQSDYFTLMRWSGSKRYLEMRLLILTADLMYRQMLSVAGLRSSSASAALITIIRKCSQLI